MSAAENGERIEQTPPMANDHGHSKGPAPKAPSSKEKTIVPNNLPKERDPRKLNQYVMLSFNEVIGEPGPGVYSFDSVWKFSSEIFTFTKLWCYRILSLVFAVPCAIIWAIIVACLSFFNIWCFIPLAKVWRIPMLVFEQVMRTTMDTFVAPITFAFGHIFSHFSTPYFTKEVTKNDKKLVCNDVHLA